MFYGNISAWGPKAEEFFGTTAKEFEVVMMGESHLSTAEFAKLAGNFTAWNRKPFHAHARYTGRSKAGTSGGVLVAPRLATALAPISRGEGADKWKPKPDGDDWMSIVMRTQGLSNIAMAGYMCHTIGPAGENLKRMAKTLEETGIELQQAMAELMGNVMMKTGAKQIAEGATRR